MNTKYQLLHIISYHSFKGQGAFNFMAKKTHTASETRDQREAQDEWGREHARDTGVLDLGFLLETATLLLDLGCYHKSFGEKLKEAEDKKVHLVREDIQRAFKRKVHGMTWLCVYVTHEAFFYAIVLHNYLIDVLDLSFLVKAATLLSDLECYQKSFGEKLKDVESK
jgi:hypothetical protein